MVEQPSKSLHAQRLKSPSLRQRRRVYAMNGANLFLKPDFERV
jgi:hypothetical protein